MGREPLTEASLCRVMDRRAVWLRILRTAPFRCNEHIITEMSLARGVVVMTIQNHAQSWPADSEVRACL
jgi:hypothetical protein